MYLNALFVYFIGAEMCIYTLWDMWRELGTIVFRCITFCWLLNAPQ